MSDTCLTVLCILSMFIAKFGGLHTLFMVLAPFPKFTSSQAFYMTDTCAFCPLNLQTYMYSTQYYALTFYHELISCWWSFVPITIHKSEKG